ncbi:MAG: DUF1194 domain-containing protein [Pseudomonadota bacterium]
MRALFLDPAINRAGIPVHGLKKAMIGIAVIGLLILFALSPPAKANDVRPVELELVLAIDTSTSVNAREFHLQRQGIADAFRHESVIEAIKVLGGEGIAVTIVQWAGERNHETVVDWTHIRDETDARQFADRVALIERKLRGLTDIGSVIRYSTRSLSTNRFDGVRRVIDISGDGTNGGKSLPAERLNALLDGITINGLVILEPNPELWEFGLIEHYQNEVIGGDGAFLMKAQSFEDFAIVIRRKLIREIIGLSLSYHPSRPLKPRDMAGWFLLTEQPHP